MARSLRAVALLLTLPPALCAQEAEFRAGLDAVGKSAREGRWQAARQKLATLLEDHRGAIYARGHVATIVEHHRRCAFHLAHPRPQPKDLLSGKLLAWNPRTAAIKIRYTPDALDDFRPQRNGVAVPRISLGGPMIHPMVFSGEHTITVKGRSYPARGMNAGTVRIFVCMSDNRAIDVDFGQPPLVLGNMQYYKPMSIGASVGRQREELAARKSSPVKPGKPYVCQVRVGKSEVRAYYNGRLILKAAKPANTFGRAAFAAGGFTTATFEGTIERAWIENTIDLHVTSARKDFDRTFDPRAGLPGWLFEPVTAEAETAKAARRGQELPGSPTRRDRERLDAAIVALNDGRWQAAIDRLDELPDELAAVAQSYLRAIALYKLGEPTRSLREARRARDGDPDFVDARLLYGRLLIADGQTEPALGELRAVLDKQPGHADAALDAGRLLLRRNRLDEANEIVSAALTTNTTHSELRAFARTLMLARQGPDWTSRHEHESKHYHVFSDIDQRTCFEAAQLLERVYTAYQADLGWVKRSATAPRFRVYLFSGRAGYEAYTRNVLGSTLAHTAGLYSPQLKQLLIWNLPEKAAMLQTICHEGFHQYLDSVMPQPPLWFNEGLAEYYEVGAQVDGRFRGGQIADNHVALLRERRADLVPLPRFLRTDRTAFHADPALHYAQAWAVVHFLRHGPRSNRELFRTIFDALSAGGDDALGRALDGVDVEKLDREFRAYLEQL